MNNLRCQFGYISLLALLVLLSGSAGLLKLTTLNTGGSSGLRAVNAKQLPLRHSRQALLSYTALYPWLYGPQGAGPGHLPCPDTDHSTVTDTQAQLKDGPNPPCGRQPLSAGQLPRRVNLSGGRYAFSSLASARLGYHVHSSVINNPLNRKVNPSLLLDDNNPVSALARISIPGSESVPTDARGVLSVITPASLLLAIRPGVAAWIIERMELLGTDSCVLKADAIVGSHWAPGTNSSPGVSAESNPDELSMAHAEQEEHKALDKPQSTRCQRSEALAGLCIGALEPQSRVTSTSAMDEKTALQILLWLVDSIPELDACPDNIASLLTFDQVSLTRHWFYRNQWYAWIRVESLHGCENNESVQCKLNYRPTNALAELSEPLILESLP